MGKGGAQDRGWEDSKGVLLQGGTAEGPQGSEKKKEQQRPQGHLGKCWHLETGDEGAPDCSRATDPGVPAGHAPVSARKDG